MAKYSNKYLMNAREAIFDGLTFDEFYYNYSGEKVKRKYAQRAWNRATTLAENDQEWNKFLINNFIERFGGFVTGLKNYYQEGFGVSDLANALGISCKAILEIVHSQEG